MTKIIASVVIASACFASAADVLWYRQPAANWNEALPIGNGRLGGMVFGDPQNDHIQLNEDTVWAGEKRDRNNPEAAKSLPEIRRLLFAGMPHEAELLADKTMIAIPRRMPPYQTMADLRIGLADPGQISNYRRELDLDTAVVRLTYQAGDANYTREYFSSAPDQVIVVRLTCDKPHHINIGTLLTREPDPQHVGALIDAKTRLSGADRIVLEGEAVARDARHDQERPIGVKFQTVLLATQEGGKISHDDRTELTILDANSVTLFIVGSPGTELEFAL